MSQTLDERVLSVSDRVEKVIASIYLDDFIAASESSFGLLTHHLT